MIQRTQITIYSNHTPYFVVDSSEMKIENLIHLQTTTSIRCEESPKAYASTVYSMEFSISQKKMGTRLSYCNFFKIDKINYVDAPFGFLCLACS